jgi:hypothetical protein
MSVADMGTKERVSAIAGAQKVVTLDPDDPAIDSLMMAYRTAFGLGQRHRPSERALVWRGVLYNDKIVAVYGEHLHGRELEITDAYFDHSIEGKIAFVTMAYHYRAMLEAGEVDALVHTILYANKDHWQAIVRESGDEPYCMTFVHRRKVG